MFAAVPANPSFPNIEEEILQYWKDNEIYEKSLENRRDAPRFVFYEGPPTANGMPHPGHCLTRAIKDLFPRYRAMRGYFCERKAGWDTHGLPVEVEVCKELGIHSKEEIEAYGVEPFIQKCQQSVWRYMQEWERLTERIGFWIHLEDAYVTYHQSYIESVWWSLKNLFDRGLLYQGHKIVWWWAQGGTALSAGEVGQGYRDTADPSVFVRFPLVDEENTSLVVWTTTPWTLPSNQFAAVHADLEYSVVVDAETEERLVLASALVETVAAKAKRDWKVESTRMGKDLIGQRYMPPFDYYHKTLGEVEGELKEGGTQHVAWRVVAGEFVTTESGTGIVHQAPAFGEVDYQVLVDERERFADGEGPDLICAVGPNGKFTSDAPEYEGRWVKEADKDLSRELRERGLLVLLDQYLHSYPFCWRAEEDPLIQYPRESWFIKTTAFKDKLLENNAGIDWSPEHIKDGRFGNFLESNVDWALSRERYWGTPLPIWVCQETGKQEAVDRYEDLLAKPGMTGAEVWEAAKKANPELPDDLRVHKPYIDEITYDSPFAEGARMVRVPEVIDCWYDSGAMPFAQWGYPHQGKEEFAQQFPADFISEAIDQTRGWFYSQLAISTMLFGDRETEGEDHDQHAYPHPFKSCIVLGLMLAEWWEDKKDSNKRYLTLEEAKEACGDAHNHKIGKMSKQLRNYRSPNEIFDKYGADALRWYFFANQAPWNSILYSEKAIKESIPEYMLRLYNVYKFFVEAAIADGFSPKDRLAENVGELTAADIANGEGYRPVSERSELDRWLLSELHRTLREVVQRMDDYDNYLACTALNDFVDKLSNWWLRRSKERFWVNEADANEKEKTEKLDAYWTLYECLVTLSKATAPFTPFFGEMLWSNLTGEFAAEGSNSGVVESVHLCNYPEGDAVFIDEALSAEMNLVREVVSLVHNVRKENRLKVRQPLSKLEVVLTEPSHVDAILRHSDLIRDEVNVKTVECTEHAEEYISYQIAPNFKLLGQKLRGAMPKVKKLLGEADGDLLHQELKEHGVIKLTVEGEVIELTDEEIAIRLQAKEGYAATEGQNSVVVLATELTPELIAEGTARDVNRLVQDYRKELQLDISDRIQLALVTECADLAAAIEANCEYLQEASLAESLVFAPLADVEGAEREVAGEAITLYLVKA